MSIHADVYGMKFGKTWEWCS